MLEYEQPMAQFHVTRDELGTHLWMGLPSLSYGMSWHYVRELPRQVPEVTPMERASRELDRMNVV